jgi:hypothetical protein
VIKINSRGLSARNQGLRRKKPGRRVDSRETEGLFNKNTKRRGIGRCRLSDLRSTTEIRSLERARGGGGGGWARAHTDRRARAASDLGPAGGTDRSGPSTGAQVSGTPGRSDLKRVIEIRSSLFKIGPSDSG